jgi:hypothetical protein
MALGLAASKFTIPLEKVDLSEYAEHQEMMGEDGHPIVQASGKTMTKTMGVTTNGYVGKVYFGSDYQPANLLFDTGSQYITVTSSVCKNCESMAYNVESSEFAEDRKDDRGIEYKERQIHVSTKNYQDRVCLANSGKNNIQNFCVSPMDFYAIKSQKNMYSGIDGFFGMGPNTHKKQRTFLGNFVYQASETPHLTSHSTFGILVSPDTSVRSHEITIGGYNTDVIEQGELGIDWFSLYKDDSWIVKLTQSFWGQEHIGVNVTLQAMFNIGFEGIGVPETQFKKIRKALQKQDDDWYCTHNECYNLKDCSDLHGWVPDWSFSLENMVNYTVSGNDLIKDDDSLIHNKKYKCKLMVYHLEHYWYHFLIGDTFLRNYYSVYDATRKQVGIGKLKPVSALAPKQDDDTATVDDSDNTTVIDHPTDGRDPTSTTSSNNNGKGALLIVTLILSVVVIALIIGIVWVKLSSKAAGKGNKLSTAGNVANRGNSGYV